MENNIVAPKTEKESVISTVASVFVSLFFVAGLICLMYVTLTSKKETFSFFENRNLSEFPEYTVEGALDGSYFTSVDTYIREHSAFRTSMLKLNTYVDKDIIRRPVVNDIVIAGDVLLPFNEYEVVDENEIVAQAEGAALKHETTAKTVESYGGKYYYVALPTQYMCHGDKYPWYLSDRSEYLAFSSSVFFSELNKRGVSLIDMMEYYEKAGRPEYFSSGVDHHFGIIGAYETYLEIVRRFREDTELDIPVLSESDYVLETVPNKYIGSRSRKIIGMWESDERLGIIRPKEDIPFERYNNGFHIAPTLCYLPENENEDVLYTMYMGGDVAHTMIDTGREELPKVLIYGESFTNAIETIAWYSFDEMHSIDPRYYKDKTVDELIAELQPDLVVCVRDYSVLLREEWSE